MGADILGYCVMKECSVNIPRPSDAAVLRGVGAVKYDGEGEVRRLSLEYVEQRLRRISEELVELAGELEEIKKWRMK